MESLERKNSLPQVGPLRVSPILLNFPKSTEERFRKHYLATMKLRVRLGSVTAFVSGSVMMIMFAIFSQKPMGELVPNYKWYIGGMLSLLVAQIAITCINAIEKLIEPLIVVGSYAYCGLVIRACAEIPEEWYRILFPAFVLDIVTYYFARGLRTPVAFVTAIGVSILYGIASWQKGVYPTVYGPPGAMIGYLIIANVIGLTLLRLIERQARQQFIMNEMLQSEQQTAERLLRNVLPDAIARRLKSGSEPPADQHGEVTVLFADLVGFTQLSSKLPASKLVSFLNLLFSRFDELAEQYGLEKIKTIGDAYMAVAGLPEFCPDHATRVARFAIAMRAAVDEIATREGYASRVRIGIHTGPVVAGVIGKRKFAYDLWGDTVNVASRMESTASVGEIQVSDATRAILRGQFRFSEPSTKAVKGKGEMTTFTLLGEVASAADSVTSGAA